MPNDRNHLARFDNFIFDFSERSMQLEGKLIDLPPRTIAIIEFLIRNRGRWISSDELMAECWPGVSVSIGSVHRQISDIRRALGDPPKKPRYVATRYKLGYRFTAEVSEQNAATSPESAPATMPRTGIYPTLKSLALSVVVLAGVVLAARAMVVPHDVKVLESVHLTADGRQKLGPLVTDGRSIFFREALGNSFRIVSIPVSGGDAVPLGIVLPNVSPVHATADGSHLILLSFDHDVGSVWDFSRSSGELHTLVTGVRDAAVSPDGQRIAALTGKTLSVSSLSGGGRVARQLAGWPESLRWSKDNRTLRFSTKEFTGSSSSSAWELNSSSLESRRLSEISQGHQVLASWDWSRSGRYFFIEAGTESNRDIWVTRESRRILEDHAPRRLTNGEPGSWQSPCADPNDESNLFTLNRYTRSDLVRYDSASRTWKSDWESVPGEEVSWSPDRQWVTYTRLPDYSIWKSRPDGSARIRLTASGIEARQPHWSPEGKRIAFMGKNSQGAWRVYRIQVSGGTAEELVPHGEDQGVPTWSPDGRSLIFGERLTSKPRADMSIHVLDLTSRKLSEMPGTRGLWSPRWSPDGKYVLAITTDSRALRILNCDSGEWREVSRMLNIDHASWSPNSQYVQFVGQDINNRRSLYRLVVANSAIEPVVDITTFDGGTDSWFGISPDGSPIAHRDLTVEEIFKLKVALP